MLRKLIHLIGSRGIHSPGELADELNVTPHLLETMMMDLERMGYLSRIESACQSNTCDRCPQSCVMQTTQRQQGWMLTEKGAKLTR